MAKASTDVSIHPNPRKPKTIERKRANHIRNTKYRAELYSSHTGNSSWDKKVGEWHEGIKALQVGSA